MILEEYSVLILDKEEKKQGTGTLFYEQGSDRFYVFTCAHALDNLEEIHVRILTDPKGEEAQEWEAVAWAAQVVYSPIDQVVSLSASEKRHSCDIAVIVCEKKDLPIRPTEFMFYSMDEKEMIQAVGYPGRYEPKEPLYYQQDELKGKVIKCQKQGNHFVIRVDDPFMNQADRVAELKGFSGSPVWEGESCQRDVFLYGGLIAYTGDGDASRARVNVMKGRLIQSLMKEAFGVQTENYLPGIPVEDIAPGCQLPDVNDTGGSGAEALKETAAIDLHVVRDSWIAHETKKIITYIDALWMQSAIDTALDAISNREFKNCTEEQRLHVYRRLMECYRACRDFDRYDEVLTQMNSEGICDKEQDFHLAVRYLEEGNYELADESIEKALEQNPAGKTEKVFQLTIQAMKDETCQVSVFKPVLGSSDQLLFTSCSLREEEGIYQILGYVLGMRFHQWGRAVRCLNRAYKISGNLMILETLATTYYFYSMRDAYIEEGTDRVDPLKINQADLYKARNSYLRILAAADERYKAGLIKRTGLQMFKCFVFLKDNYRIYRHYQDMMEYYEFQDREQLRMTQIDYLYVAIKRGRQKISSFQGLTKNDKKYFELLTELETWMRIFDSGISKKVEIPQNDLLRLVSYAEKVLQELEKETENEQNLNRNILRIDLINLYGNGILRYRWSAIDAVKRHYQALEKEKAEELELESLGLYLFELESGDYQASERKYREFFEKHKNVISYTEWIHFYTRNGRRDQSRKLYESAFEDRKYLIEEQPEYFYRAYIMFIIDNQLDLKYALECFINHRSEMEDDMVRMLLEVELQFDSCSFNDPELMLGNIELLYQEGLMLEDDYRYKSLIVNMLNGRLKEAGKYINPEHTKSPDLLTKAEMAFCILCGANAGTNPHWNPMSGWSLKDIFRKYAQEKWRKNSIDVLAAYSVKERKTMAVDLWALYIMACQETIGMLGDFSQVYITHRTFSDCIQEANNTNDPIIRRLLTIFASADNIVWRSPTLEEQLLVRNENEIYEEFYGALAVAEVMDCPILLGEHRYPIPERFHSRIIRPDLS